MWESSVAAAAHPKALKLILGLGGVFVLVLLGVRLAEFIALVQAVLDGMPFVLVEPDAPANLWLVVATAAALLAFLLPRAWRKFAWAPLFVGALLLVAFSGSLTARGGPGVADTPVGHWLQSRGYARCPAGDRIRGGERSTRAEHMAEGWAQPGGCVAPFDVSG